MPNGILLNNRNYFHRELLRIDTDESGFTNFEQEVISFYQIWHSGASVFEFKTSGTTGRPKTISFHRDHLAHSARITLQTLNLKANQNCLLNLSPHFVAGKMMLVRALIGLLNIVAVEPSANPLEQITGGIDFAAFVPSQLHKILNDQLTCRKFSQIEKVIIGGGDIFFEDLEKLKGMKNTVFHTYGMTETLTHIALRKISGKKPENYFRVLEGFQIKTDKRGCLKIKTPYQADWLATNDLVEIENKNQFIWKGRLDNVINSGGIKIIPEEIEPAIFQYLNKMGVRNPFFVTGIPDNHLGQKVVLIFEGELQTDLKDLLSGLKTQLPAYHNPKDVYLTPGFIYTTSGKLNRLTTLQKLFET